MDATASGPALECSICLDPVGRTVDGLNGDGDSLTDNGRTATTVLFSHCPAYPLCPVIYCHPCLQRWFLGAADRLTLHPVQCCGCGADLIDGMLPVTTETTREPTTERTTTEPPCLLSDDDRTAVLLRRAEWQARGPALCYCPVATCSAFIPAGDGQLRCPRCGTAVCPGCRGLQHDDVDSGQRDDVNGGQHNHDASYRARPCSRANVHRDQQFLAVMASRGCKLCPGCQTPVERLPDGACDEVECLLCGKAFCFQCLGDAETCQCSGGRINDSDCDSASRHPNFTESVWKADQTEAWTAKEQLGRQLCWRLRTTTGPSGSIRKNKPAL